MSTEQYCGFSDEALEQDEVALRELFERRAAALVPPQSLEARVMSAVDAVAQARAGRRASRASATRIAFALAACVTAFVGNAWLGQGSPSVSHSARSSETMAMSSSMDEPLACAFPVSGFVSASAQACSGPTQTSSSMHDVTRDERVCEEALASIAAR